MAGVLASCEHETYPKDLPLPAWVGLWWTTVTARTPGLRSEREPLPRIGPGRLADRRRPPCDHNHMFQSLVTECACQVGDLVRHLGESPQPASSGMDDRFVEQAELVFVGRLKDR